MQVILTEDVFELGKRGQVVKVANGYGRNYLIPKHLAIPATPGNMKTIEGQRMALAKKEAHYREEADLLAGELSQLHLLVSRKAGERGVLFGSVTAKDVVELLRTQGIQIDRRKVLVDHPIKSIGNYEIVVRPHSEVEAKVLTSVMIEGDSPVFQVKRKDPESDQIVADLNAKVREIGLPGEGRVITESVAPEPEELEGTESVEATEEQTATPVGPPETTDSDEATPSEEAAEDKPAE